MSKVDEKLKDATAEDEVLAASKAAWTARVRMAAHKTQASRGTACLRAEEHLGEQVRITGCAILPMEGGDYEITEKGVVFPTLGKPIAFYSFAGLASVKAVIEELGEGPYPFPVEAEIAEQSSKRGTKAVLSLVTPDED